MTYSQPVYYLNHTSQIQSTIFILTFAQSYSQDSGKTPLFYQVFNRFHQSYPHLVDNTGDIYTHFTQDSAYLPTHLSTNPQKCAQKKTLLR